MNLYDSKIWNNDLDEVIDAFPELNELAGKSIIVTGCTGLICSAVVDLLIRWNELHNDKIIIFAAGRNEKDINERFKPFCKEWWFQTICFDITYMGEISDFSCDYIIHGAGNASPNMIIKEPSETLVGSVLGTQKLLEYAKLYNVKRLLYISSSEVYGKKDGNNPFQIDEYGYIDLLNARNSYSIGKRAAETLCISYAEEYSSDVVIARPGHIYGPTAKENDNRVSSVWAFDVAKGNDIVMKSDGMQIRSYCYCLDCATALLIMLLKGKNKSAYNISNPDSMFSIREMADLMSKVGNVSINMDIPTESEKKGFNPMTNSSLNSDNLLELGWKGLFLPYRGIEHTIKVLKEIGV